MEDHYLFIKIIPGGLWIDFVKEVVDFFIIDDLQYVKWFKNSEYFIFNIQNNLLSNSISAFFEQYQHVTHFFTDYDNNLPQGSWNDLSSTYRTFENFRE